MEDFISHITWRVEVDVIHAGPLGQLGRGARLDDGALVDPVGKAVEHLRGWPGEPGWSVGLVVQHLVGGNLAGKIVANLPPFRGRVVTRRALLRLLIRLGAGAAPHTVVEAATC